MTTLLTHSYFKNTSYTNSLEKNSNSLSNNLIKLIDYFINFIKIIIIPINTKNHYLYLII